MASLLKKQILKRLARFTKSLNSDDIDLNLSRGTGALKNLELDAEYISQITNLPPWLEITSILCDNIKVEVHITKIQTKPIHIVIDSIDVHISVVDAIKLRQKHELPARKQSTGGKYGLTEKMLDSMFVEIETINIDFSSSQFHADLFVSGVTLKCTDHEFKSCFENLLKSRPVNNTDQSVTVFRQLSLSCIKANAKSARLTDSTSKGEDRNIQSIRLNCDHSFVNFATKKKLSDCSHMCSKFVIQLGVLSFILNDSELKEASNFLQHLKQLHELAKAMEQEQATTESSPPPPPSPSLSAARESESRSSPSSKIKRRQTSESSPYHHKPLKKSSSGLSANLLQKDEEGKVDISASVMHLQSTLIHEDQNIEAYQLGKKRIPPAVIVQTSVHFRVQKLDVHLCCHTGELVAGQQSLESTYIQFSGIGLDIYPDQKAGSKRHHWANFDYKFQDRTDWGYGLLKDTQRKVSRVQSGTSLTLLGVSLDRLRESVICFRCVDFSISPVCVGDILDKQRPFIASDKGSYKFAQDAPTIWIDFTAYFYPIIAQNRYLIPRPNLYIHINPVQVTFYQDTFLWFVKFIIKMAVTLKLGENDCEEEKQSPKKQKVGEFTLIGRNQLKGMDIRVATLMTKVTIPVSYPTEVKDRPDRPVAVQLDISEVTIENHTAADLIDSCEGIVKFLQRIHSDWLLKSQNEYPHATDDLSVRPTILRNLLTLLHLKESKQKGNFGDLEKMKKTQLWHIEFKHFLISLVSSLTEEGVMRPDEIMEPLSLEIWIATNIISNLKPLAELGKHLSDVDTDAINDNPMIYYLVSIPNVLDINLKRVVFLSLMRLKDTINALKEDVLSEVRKLDRFNKESPERGVEEGSSLLKISGIVSFEKLCVSLPLPLQLQKSVSTQCDPDISDSPPLTELYRKVSHSSVSNRSSGDFSGTRPRSCLESLDEFTNEDNQSTFTSSLSSDGSSVNADQISITSSQMNVFDSDAVTMEQLHFVSPDFHQQSFFASFSHKLTDNATGKRGHKPQPVKQKVLSVIDLLSLADEKDILANGRVLSNNDILTYVLRLYMNKLTLIPEIIGEKVKVKGTLNHLSFAEEPVQVNEFIDQHNNPRRHAKHLKNFPLNPGAYSPVIKFVAELGNHVKEEYSEYCPPPTLSVDARVQGLSGAIYASHLKALKEIVKDEVLPSPTTIPISIALKDLKITLAELPNSPDNDVNIGIESLHIFRAPDYKLSLKSPRMTQLLENSMDIQLRERVMSDELRDEDTPRPQEQDSATSFSEKSVSSQSDFTEIEALPEYSQALLDELRETKQNYDITLALNHSMKRELEDFKTKVSSNKEVFNKTFNDVQNLATNNSTLLKQVNSLEDRTQDYENALSDIKIAKRSVETLLKSKVDELEENKRNTHVYQTEIVNLRDKIESLKLNKNSLMEILERNSEEIRELTLRNSELSELTN